MLGSQHTERFFESLPAYIDALPSGIRATVLAKHVQYCLAGRAAESVLLGRVTRRYVGDDAVEALRFVEMAGYLPVASLHLDREWVRVRTWLMRHRVHLSRFADVLMTRRTIEGQEVRELILELPQLRRPTQRRS
jgi:ATP-dependent Zn protease